MGTSPLPQNRRVCAQWFSPLPRQPQVVEHPVDRNAGEGNVEPHGQSPAGEAAVPVESPLPGALKRHKRQRHHGPCEHRVRGEQPEVNRPDPSLPGEAGSAVQVVVTQIADEEKGRSAEGREHAGPVRLNVFPPDGDIPEWVART